MSGGQVRATGHSFTAAEDIEKYRLVYLSAARTVSKARPGDTVIGVCEELCDISKNDQASIRLINGPGSMELKANGAITANAPVYAVEDGKIDDFGVGEPIGWALEAATADGDIIEVLLKGAIDSTSGLGVNFTLEDDFFTYVDADEWTLLASDSGTAAVGDAAGGVLTLSASDGTAGDNDESYLSSTHECWKVAAAKPLYFQARVKNTEANTDDANWFVGLSDTITANFLQDNGAGPAASYDGFGFFKVDGGTVIQFESSNAATQVTDTDVGDVTSGTQMKLEILCVPTSATAATVHAILNGTLVASNALTITGMAEMHLHFGVKNGDTNAETLLIDYVHVSQVR